MRISLRKAGTLERRLATVVGEIKVRATADVPAFDHKPMATLAAACETFLIALAPVEELEAVRFRIRAAIGGANATAGITELLARRARLEAGWKRLAERLKDAEPIDERQLAARLKAAQKRFADDYVFARRQSAGVEVTVLDAATMAELQDRAAALRRELDAVEDRLAQLNAEHVIELDEADVACLRGAGLV